MRHAIGPVLLLACLAAPMAAADTVHLRDGRTLQGQLKRHGPVGWVVDSPGRKPDYFSDADVDRIEVSARPANDPVASARRLAVVRAAAAATDDPVQAVARYDALLASPLDPVTAADARADRAVWQDRSDRHLVKLADRWVPAAAREQAAADSLAAAGAARELVKAGQFAAADPVVTAALAMDPQDASALYLQGLVRAQQNQPAAARRAFEAAAAAVPNHGPTLNNLAVILFQQRQYPAALARFDEAMVAAPGAQAVLDNVAVALASLPPPLARLPAAAGVAARFQAQAKDLTDRMTAMGMHRLGSAWLTDAQVADVGRAQQADRARLDALTADFDGAQDVVRRTDLDIADVQQQMRRSRSGDVGPYLTSFDGGRSGGLPTVYFELQNDADQLQRRRASQVAHLDDLKKQAAAIQGRLAAAAAGPTEQHLIGPEGTPVRLPQ